MNTLPLVEVLHVYGASKWYFHPTRFPSCERSCKTCNSGIVEDEEHFCVDCPGLKKARCPLLKLMEQAQSEFGLLQDEEKFIGIMLHANADR